MLCRTPRSTRTDTLLPYTTPFRSNGRDSNLGGTGVRCVIRNWWDAPSARRLSRELFGSEEGSHATPSEVSVTRSEEHTSELQSLKRTSYAVFCWKKKKKKIHHKNETLDIPTHKQ